MYIKARSTQEDHQVELVYSDGVLENIYFHCLDVYAVEIHEKKVPVDSPVQVHSVGLQLQVVDPLLATPRFFQYHCSWVKKVLQTGF